MALAKTAAALGVLAIAVTGCSGEVETRKLTDQQMTDTGHWMEGVIIYQPALFVEISSKTTLTEGGKMKGSSADKPPACVPVQAEKTVALPDLKNPYQIKYKPGLFDSNTFGLTLQIGTLTSINGNSAAAMNASGSGSGGAAAGGALASLPPIPTPLGIPLSSPAAPTDGYLQVRAIQGAHPQRIQLRTNLPACNDGPVILGYRRLSLP